MQYDHGWNEISKKLHLRSGLNLSRRTSLFENTSTGTVERFFASFSRIVSDSGRSIDTSSIQISDN